MKALLLILLFFSLQLLAQDTKPRLFIGIYESAKNGFCSSYEFTKDEIEQYAEYGIKRKQFLETHTKNAQTTLVENNEAVIIYRYDKKYADWKCTSKVVSYKKGKSIESCQKELSDQQEKNPTHFATKPEILFTWQGNTNKTEYAADYGGLKGKFIAADLPTKSIILAKLTNATKDQLAYVQLITDDGKKHFESLDPGATLTKKFDTETLEVSVVYKKNDKPKEPFNLIDFVKGHIRDRVTKKGKVITGTVFGARS